MCHGVTGWNDPIGFVEAACQNYEALVEEKRVGNGDGAGARPSWRDETRGTQRREGPNSPQGYNERWKEKGNLPNFKLFSEIEQATDLKKVMEERILYNRIEFTLQ